MLRPCYFRAVPDPTPYRTSLHRLGDPSVRPAWDRLVAASPQRTAFAHAAFGEAVEAALGLPALVAAVWEGDRLRAGALVFEKRLGPYRAAALPPLAQYVSPLLDAEPAEADVHAQRSPLDALLGLLAAEFHQASLVLHPSLADARTLQWAGWRVTPAYTYRIALSPDVPATDGWSGNPRRVLRKERDRFEVDEGAVGLAEALALVRCSHERQGEALPVTLPQLERLAAPLVEARLARVFVARADGRAEAGLVVLSDGRTAHYWLAGSAPGAGMTVLLADVLERLRAERVSYFDLSGANVPSIAEFKRRFGAALVPYFRARLTTRPELRLLDALRR